MLSEQNQARLNLLRFGMIVMTVIVLVLTLLVPSVIFSAMGQPINVGQVLGPAILATIAAAIIGAVVVYVYRWFLLRQQGA